MVLKLYAQDISPPCRSVYLTAAALGLELELIVIDLWKKQQYSETYLKINPNHTIPTLDDEGTTISDSHAIIIYLVTKYGKDDFFYPNDLKVRALINEVLFYNAGVIFPVLKKLILKIAAKKNINERDTLEVKNIYQSLEGRLKHSMWLSGKTVTIADFAVSSCVTSLNVIEPLHQQKYPNLWKWIKNINKLPYFHVNEKGLNDLKELANKKLSVKSAL